MDIEPTSSLNFHLTLHAMPSSSSSEQTKEQVTVYFGYGSNLWRHQMRQRCPTSKFLGIARLKGWRWIIHERGYANVVEEDDEIRAEAVKSSGGKGGKTKHDYNHEVWGLVYSLEKEDEEDLDRNEGVPAAYTKEWIECEFWKKVEEESQEEGWLKEREEGFNSGKRINISGKAGKKVNMLVYVDRKRVKESEPKEEYVYRMNRGIRDAVREGVPREYVREVMRRFIPEEEEGGMREEDVTGVARKQARGFEEVQ